MEETYNIDRTGKRRELINLIVLLGMFVIYMLVFTIAKFYDIYNIQYPCAGPVNFCMLAILVFNNADVFALIKKRDKELLILAALIVITGINLFVVDSGKGAFFVPVNFLLIWYVSDKMYISKKGMRIMAAAYMAFLLFYLFIALFHVG